MYGVYGSNNALLGIFDDAAEAASFLLDVQKFDPFAYMQMEV
jgi:hypothetical protein